MLFSISKKCVELFEEKKMKEINLMEIIANKDLLHHIHKSFHEEQDKRENETPAMV